MFEPLHVSHPSLKLVCDGVNPASLASYDICEIQDHDFQTPGMLPCWFDPSTKFMDFHPNQSSMKWSTEEQSCCFTGEDFTDDFAPFDLSDATEDVVFDAKPTTPVTAEPSKDSTPRTANEFSSCLPIDRTVMKSSTNYTGCLPLKLPQYHHSPSTPVADSSEPNIFHDMGGHKERPGRKVDFDTCHSSFEFHATPRPNRLLAKPQRIAALTQIDKRMQTRKNHRSQKSQTWNTKPSCALCFQTFTRETDRDRHLSSVHKEPQFHERSQCRFCRKEFSRPDAKARHEKSRPALCRKIAKQGPKLMPE
ncbi:hypothetical protein VNI00_013853 [Paramarasmius palmivorus]|uniref:C2H2-type domain-containing protein n=1 Tax=Paramarasmius palmivorus TaxID=297713 RepID=A0AAW0BXZ0_9AGAR